MMYISWIHRIFRGHWLVREVIGYDKYNFDILRGCEICKIEGSVHYMQDRHDNMICPKQLLGYWRECKGGVRNGVAYGECGDD